MTGRWRARLIIAVLTVLAYGPVLRAPFMFDDHEVIEHHSLWQLSWPSELRRDFFPPPGDFWSDSYFRPLQLMTHHLDVALWGLNPVGHHLTNLLLHIVCACLVMEVGLLLGLAAPAGLLAGVLFGIHPIIVSELLMVSGRPEILSLLFSLLAVLCFWQTSYRFLLVGSCAYLAALLSKESGLATPLFIGLVLWFGKRQEKLIPKVSLLIATSGLYLILRHVAGTPSPAMFPSHGWIFLFAKLPMVLLRSARLLVFPWPLYMYRQLPSPHLGWGIAAIAIGAATLLGLPTKQSVPVLGALWFLAAWVPKGPIVASGFFMLDHWSYPALPGLLWPLAQGACRWQTQRSALLAQGSKAVVAMLVLSLILVTRLQIKLRDSDEKNYRWSLRYTRATPLYFNLGLLCLRSGRPSEALAYFEPVLQLYPQDPNIVAATNAARAAAR